MSKEAKAREGEIPGFRSLNTPIRPNSTWFVTFRHDTLPEFCRRE